MCEPLSDKSGYMESEKGMIIDNLPAPNKGKLTGHWKIDYYGCWWEVKRKDGTKFWMIGEYPDRVKGG